MGEVVSLSKHRHKPTPHGSGPAQCLECGYECAIVWEIGPDIAFECPTCKTDKLMPVGLVYDDEAPYWHCACGGWAFAVRHDGFHCLRCGVAQCFDDSGGNDAS